MKKKKQQRRLVKKVRVVHVLSVVDADILRDLIAARSIAYSFKGWLTPMFLGGTDGSQHSGRLKRLMGAGLVERKQRGGHTRPSFLYRITPALRMVA